MNNDLFGDCVSSRGQIYVNRSMQITNENPVELQANLKETKIYRNIFSLGDVCLTNLNEEKTIYPLKEMAKTVIKNILALG
mmetsp:Transcript_44388/g.43056  ORF Transcript_44388/g.43056 Transcript_44388/m.43056 type:complete len:81 (-) Transcript_44388:365-607(-)